MSGSLHVGMEGWEEFEVDDRLLTDAGGTLSTQVLSTPGMIAMMEHTASKLVYPALEDGKATVGFEVTAQDGRTIGVGRHERRVIGSPGPGAG
jgi:predicted thioesterase